MTEANYIDLTGVNTKDGFKYILELLERTKKQSVIKEVEVNAVIDLVKKIELEVSDLDNYKRKSDLFEITLKLLTTVQKDKLIKEMI